MNKAKIIVKSIIEDLTDRKGLQNEWENIDKDIQDEIVETWEKLINDILETSSKIDNNLVEEFDSQFKNCHINPACKEDIRNFLTQQQKKYE